MDNVYAIIRISPRLEAYCTKADRAMEKTALDTARETAALVGEMERLIELKRQLVNLSVISKEMTGRLTDKERAALGLGAAGAGYAAIGKALGISCSSAARLIIYVKEKCARFLAHRDIERYEELLGRFAG